ncbi:MAG: hypothetical protein JOY61_12760 [Chloroflexi bacterium]|nr:hypothetical protein [Chloroflexota bacterium]
MHRIPDGETGDRQNWIWFQLEKFWHTPGIERAGAQDQTQGYEQMPKVRLAASADPSSLQWPNLGYADAYVSSFKSFQRMRDAGTIGRDVRFQVEYPTPLAAINAWFVVEDQPRVEPSYERALFADLQNLLARLPHADIAVQWDVAVEIAILENAFEAAPGQDLKTIVQRLARCVDQVPSDVPVGLHLCYGDYKHSHYKEPDSLDLQVQLTNGVAEVAKRSISWVAFTVPQYQRSAPYFAPLRELRVATETELNFALVPYHVANQEQGTTAEQVRLIDEYLASSAAGARSGWGICTECGMARAERAEVPQLLDLHREILDRYGTAH